MLDLSVYDIDDAFGVLQDSLHQLNSGRPTSAFFSSALDGEDNVFQGLESCLELDCLRVLAFAIEPLAGGGGELLEDAELVRLDRLDKIVVFNEVATAVDERLEFVQGFLAQDTVPV